jgi:hypothetical protein
MHVGSRKPNFTLGFLRGLAAGRDGAAPGATGQGSREWSYLLSQATSTDCTAPLSESALRNPSTDLCQRSTPTAL